MERFRQIVISQQVKQPVTLVKIQRRANSLIGKRSIHSCRSRVGLEQMEVEKNRSRFALLNWRIPKANHDEV
jgi:hypothetical protein